MPKLHDYDKILTRLTIILQRLYEGELLHVTDLAAEFNVSTKTIQRDFNERLIRFPIEKSGRAWRMQNGYNLTKERTAEESLVLEMLSDIANSIGLEFGSYAQHLFSKLQNSSKNPIHSKTVIEDISDNVQLFNSMEKAINDFNTITFVYNDKKRNINPYKIVSFEGYWYLYGEDLTDNRLKTFYFKNIYSLVISVHNFEPDVNIYKILEHSINAWFEPNNTPFEVSLHASVNIAKYFDRRPLSKTQRVQKVYDDGSIDLVLLTTSDNEILHEVKKWMPDLVVLSPKHLVKKSKDIATQFLNNQFGD